MKKTLEQYIFEIQISKTFIKCVSGHIWNAFNMLFDLFEDEIEFSSNGAGLCVQMLLFDSQCTRVEKG